MRGFFHKTVLLNNVENRYQEKKLSTKTKHTESIKDGDYAEKSTRMMQTQKQKFTFLKGQEAQRQFRQRRPKLYLDYMPVLSKFF